MPGATILLSIHVYLKVREWVIGAVDSASDLKRKVTGSNPTVVCEIPIGDYKTKPVVCTAVQRHEKCNNIYINKKSYKYVWYKLHICQSYIGGYHAQYTTLLNSQLQQLNCTHKREIL